MWHSSMLDILWLLFLITKMLTRDATVVVIIDNVPLHA